MEHDEDPPNNGPPDAAPQDENAKPRNVTPWYASWLFPLGITIVGTIALAAQWISNRIHPDTSETSIPDGLLVISTDTLPVHLPLNLPPFALLDQDGKKVRNSELLGHPWVADFIYVECDGICPLLDRDIVDMQNDPAFAGVQFISFSAGPDDGPETLKRYLTNYPDAIQTRWRLLQADDEAIPTLAVTLGLAASIKQVHDGLLPLSNDLYLVDDKGILRGVYAGRDDKEVQRLHDDLHRMISGTSVSALPSPPIGGNG